MAALAAAAMSGCAAKKPAAESGAETQETPPPPQAPPAQEAPGASSGTPQGSAPGGIKEEEIGWSKGQTPYVFEAVHFDFDQYGIRSDAAALLERHAEWLRKNPSARVTIEGHTCNIGTETYNLALGQKRAEAVKSYLMNLGVEAGRMRVISYGLSRPAYSNDSEETRQLNRRGEFIVN
jgi:peptidoglycan-associated lipoprotein